jgi:soluble lytic murein transglycosylase
MNIPRKLSIAILIFAIIAACAAAGLSIFSLLSPLKTVFYSDGITAASREAKIDPLLIAAVINAETHFQVAAVSPRGAIGLMQVMPATAKEMAAELGISSLNDAALMDPSVNIRIGSLYLRRMLRRFNGDLVLGLAAYNAGLGTVDAWILQNPLLRYEVNDIPYEQTRTYVKYVTRTYQWLTKLRALAARLHLTTH